MTQSKPVQARPTAPADAGGAPPATVPPMDGTVLDSQSVLRGHQAITIAHNGSYYRLQTTRQGKLILTK